MARGHAQNQTPRQFCQVPVAESLRSIIRCYAHSSGEVTTAHWKFVSCSRSFVSQRHQGINLGRTPRGEVAGEQGNTSQDKSHRTERQRVCGLYSVEQTR